MTIEELKSDKIKLAIDIALLLYSFEEKYGEGTVEKIGINRWNGSNDAFGHINKNGVAIRLSF